MPTAGRQRRLLAISSRAKLVYVVCLMHLDAVGEVMLNPPDAAEIAGLHIRDYDDAMNELASHSVFVQSDWDGSVWAVQR